MAQLCWSVKNQQLLLQWKIPHAVISCCSVQVDVTGCLCAVNTKWHISFDTNSVFPVSLWMSNPVPWSCSVQVNFCFPEESKTPFANAMLWWSCAVAAVCKCGTCVLLLTFTVKYPNMTQTNVLKISNEQL